MQHLFHNLWNCKTPILLISRIEGSVLKCQNVHAACDLAYKHQNLKSLQKLFKLVRCI